MTDGVPLTTDWTRVKLRVEDYLLLDEAGAFEGYGRTELIEGNVVYINAQHRPHARIKSRLHLLLANAFSARGDGLEALVEGSVAMPPHNAPEPDIAVTVEPEGSGLIPLSSLVLVIEVADTTLTTDLGAKAVMYARAGVPEYWVVDVENRRVHQFWAATDSAYSKEHTVPFGEPLAAATIPDLEVATTSL